ncbi:MAG: hypothetical protein WKF57_05455 [Nakamurella sp.]
MTPNRRSQHAFLQNGSRLWTGSEPPRSGDAFCTDDIPEPGATRTARGTVPHRRRRRARLGRQRLAGPPFQRPFAGVRITTGLEVEHWRGYVPLPRPGQRFGHVTAVVIRGGPVLSSLTGEVHISTQGRVRVRRSGVIGHNHLRPDEARYDDLPISGPVATFAECARQLTLPDPVAVGDFLAHTPRFMREVAHRLFASIENLVSGLAATWAEREARAAGSASGPTRRRIGTGDPSAVAGHRRRPAGTRNKHRSASS